MLVYEKEREVYKSSGNYIDLTKPSLKNPQKKNLQTSLLENNWKKIINKMVLFVVKNILTRRHNGIGHRGLCGKESNNRVQFTFWWYFASQFNIFLIIFPCYGYSHLLIPWIGVFLDDIDCLLLIWGACSRGLNIRTQS